MVHDLRTLLRLAQGRKAQPSAVILNSRTLQLTPESGGRAGYDGAKRKKGSKTHMAVDTPGNLLALLVTPANEQDRDQAQQLTQKVREVIRETVDAAIVDEGCAGENAIQAANGKASVWRRSSFRM